jgi:hypothetical protein
MYLELLMSHNVTQFRIPEERSFQLHRKVNIKNKYFILPMRIVIFMSYEHYL